VSTLHLNNLTLGIALANTQCLATQLELARAGGKSGDAAHECSRKRTRHGS